jgi:hypothetical protein
MTRISGKKLQQDIAQLHIEIGAVMITNRGSEPSGTASQIGKTGLQLIYTGRSQEVDRNNTKGISEGSEIILSLYLLTEAFTTPKATSILWEDRCAIPAPTVSNRRICY